MLDSVARVASLCCKVVVHALNGFTCLAAAVYVLHLHCIQLLHERGLLICAGQFRSLETVVHVLIYAGKAVQKRCVHRVEAIAKPLLCRVSFSSKRSGRAVNLPLKRCEIACENVVIIRSAVCIAAIAPSVSAPSAEQEKNDKPEPCSVAAPCVPIVVFVASHSSNISGG